MQRLMRVMPVVVLTACQVTPVPIPVAVTTTPPGASCHAERDAIPLDDVTSTPGTLTIPAMKGTVRVTCIKPGFVTASEEWTPVYSPNVVYVGPGALIVLALQAAGPPLPKSDWLYPAEFHLDLGRVGGPVQPLPLSGLRLR